VTNRAHRDLGTDYDATLRALAVDIAPRRQHTYRHTRRQDLPKSNSAQEIEFGYVVSSARPGVSSGRVTVIVRCSLPGACHATSRASWRASAGVSGRRTPHHGLRPVQLLHRRPLVGLRRRRRDPSSGGATLDIRSLCDPRRSSVQTLDMGNHQTRARPLIGPVPGSQRGRSCGRASPRRRFH